MEEPIESEYFNWLCAKVVHENTNTNMYVDLLRILHTTPFVWSIFGDKNRAEDGVELRLDFMRESGLTPNDIWFEEPCSVLEMAIAFANRASFQTDISDRDWFWEFMTNLELDELRWLSPGSERTVGYILDRFMSRTYSDNGRGGMFPLRWPKNDQREVEIWYQFCEYLDDKGLV